MVRRWAINVLCGALGSLAAAMLVSNCLLDTAGLAVVESDEPVGGSDGCQSVNDCPGLDMPCEFRDCTSAHECSMEYGPVGRECDGEYESGSYCDGEGNCVECIVPAHCQDDYLCVDYQCVPASCTDGEKNNAETAVDCGGPLCNGCLNGQICLVATDCQSGYCVTQGASGICAACTEHQHCDGLTDRYCLDGECVHQLINGLGCSDQVECQSDHCVDGVCCDTSCQGTCDSCLQLYNGSANGTCGAVIEGEDPDGDCPASSQQCRAGGCDGNHECAPALSSVECRQSGGLCDLAEYCDGSDVGCPTDLKWGSTHLCRAANGSACDVEDYCDGSNDACPNNKSTDVCRVATLPCDVAESCDGSSDNCPADDFQPDGTQVSGCTLYLCSGTSADCPESCTGDGDCVSPAQCQGNQCVGSGGG